MRNLPAICVGVALVLRGSTGFCQPANDMFANRIVLVGTNVTVTGGNVGATMEYWDPYVAGYPGGVSVWWTWTAPVNGTITVTTAGSTFDTLLGIYTGSDLSSLVEVASNDENPLASDNTSQVVFNATAGQVYQIDVDGYYESTGGIVLHLQWQPTPPPPPAPAWAMADLNGQPVYSTNYAGKVVLLNFWATWCGPCVAEIPDLMALEDKYEADGFVIVGASLDSNINDIWDFLYSEPLNYQVTLGNSTVTSAFGGIPYIPTTFIINRQNLILKKHVGTQTYATLEQEILPLLYDGLKLSSQRSGGQLSLRWPVTAASFVLESCSPASRAWTAWPVAPVLVNGSNTVQVSVSATNALFRLRLAN
ncbi:MAG: TlpA disulfide reductase family protein [Verrucomicrobiota bacterium]